MRDDKIDRALKAFETVYGWSKDKAKYHMLLLTQEEKSAIFLSLEEWQVKEMTDEEAAIYDAEFVDR